MKTHAFQRPALAMAVVLALAAVPSLSAQAGAPVIRSAPVIQPAPSQMESNTMEQISGQSVRDSSDQQVSTVTDFLIEPRTGNLHFAVVSSGSDTFRLVPIAALDKTAPASQGLKLTVDRSRWEQVGTLTHDWLEGSISMDNEHRQRLAQQYGLSEQLPGAGTTVLLVRASQLKGRPIQSGSETLGMVSDVAIDLQNGVAWLLLQSASGMPRAGQNHLFPFDRAQVPAEGSGPITTELTKNEFAP